ncbi:hypothetical protein MAH1_34920 [Sessilibacter sp. MAH1]
MSEQFENSCAFAQPSYYVGIGASAGGLEALAEFFSHLPEGTDAAFIVVQHLSPDFKSMMPELLSKHTSMPIYQVADGVTVEANCIYLIPPRKNMLVAEGKLLLSDQMPGGHPHMPIDIFLRSLAEDQQDRAIGIILSGTGSDGTRGIKALKESGGLVIVQEPGSAKFDGMPISACNTGLADMSLPPQQMGQSILKFIRHPSISGEGTAVRLPISSNDDTLDEIFKLLRSQSSINFSQYKASTVARRIERRLGINQLTSLDAYLRLLIDSPRELQILSRELLIGVTRFFRDDDAYKNLIQQVIPKVVESHKNKREGIRLWVAGCSTGEEAYSLAILIDEEINRKNLNCTVKIFATDVDEEAIAEASSGVYSADITQDISLERLEKYFEHEDTSYVVSPKLRQMVIFAVHNMIEDPPFSNIDLVSCRNVLIYFQHSTQKKVLASLYFALKPNGYLFLGSSESLGDLQSHFEPINERARTFMKISNMRVPIGNTPPNLGVNHPSTETRVMPPISNILKTVRVGAKNGLNSVLERLVEEYAPDCIVLNSSFEAIHVYGDVSEYTKGIRPGKISNNIKDIIVDDLSVAVSTALYRCERNDGDVYYKDVMMHADSDNSISVDLSVFTVKEGEYSSSPRYYIVQFISGELEPTPKSKKISFDAFEQSRQRILDLENELIKKQENLQVTVEELETTNEELQSANEELMSANEELQSTNEELQSVNEELYTVNSEYQQKIIELVKANEDLDSVVNATKVGIIFLDEQLAIRRFTPFSAQYINLRVTDLGRPFHHLSYDLNYDNFFADVANVIAGGQEIEKTVVSKLGKDILIRILSYHSESERQKSGVLITLTDISRQKFMEKSLLETQHKIREYFKGSSRPNKRIGGDNDLKILVIDDDEVDQMAVVKLLRKIPSRRHQVAVASDIEEGLLAIESNNIDVCIVDYLLSNHTAKEFVDALVSKGLKTPVIVLSSYAEQGLDSEFLNSAVYDFLSKDDLSGQLLQRSMDYVLERQKLQDVLEDIGI